MLVTLNRDAAAVAHTPLPPPLPHTPILQVLLMPLLSELPADDDETLKYNARNVGLSSTITLLGTAGLTYWITGFFGAAE